MNYNQKCVKFLLPFNWPVLFIGSVVSCSIFITRVCWGWGGGNLQHWVSIIPAVVAKPLGHHRCLTEIHCSYLLGPSLVATNDCRIGLSSDWNSAAVAQAKGYYKQELISKVVSKKFVTFVQCLKVSPRDKAFEKVSNCFLCILSATGLLLLEIMNKATLYKPPWNSGISLLRFF